MILAKILTKKYGKITAVSKASFEVLPGEICGMLGPNGAGKTTIFKMLCGLVTPDSGSFEIKSQKQKQVGAIIEKPALYEYISARENLMVLSKMQGAPSDHKTLNGLLSIVGLSEGRQDPVKNYSLGMKQRLGLAVALINDPDCLILDEPFLGLDPLAMLSLGNLLMQLADEQGKTILISSHLLGELSKICTTLKLMRDGEIIKSGTTSEILSLTTKSFMICGKHLQSSDLLKKHQATFRGDCAVLNLEVNKAHSILRSAVAEGNEISYFGPEMNINELYGTE
jgi:ABC-type multidrug transport system ATPase subunit